LLRNDILSAINETGYVKKYRTSYIIRDSLIKIYTEIHDNKRKIFSPGLFVGLQGRLNCAILTRHVIEDVLKWDFSTAIHYISYKTLYKYHLRSTKQCYKNLYEVLMAAYPERYLKPYYFKKYKNIWFDDKGNMKHDLVKEAIRELVDIFTDKKGKYKYNFKIMPKWINYKMFQKSILPYNANLSYMLNNCFNNSPIDAIIFAYPELNLKPYYFKHVPKNYWKGKQGKKHAKQIMNELFNRLTDNNGPYKFSKKDVVNLMKYKTYHKPLLPYGKNLGGMLQALFNNSPTKPLELIDDPYICTQVCEVCNKEEREACLHNRTKMRMES